MNCHSRLWAKVDRTNGPEKCWPWTGRLIKGYGHLFFRKGGKQYSLTAHRLVWEHRNGKIPDGMFICHHCDNKKCCNPSHLFLGTNSDNMIDMTLKGKGKPRGRCKLTVDKVIDMRKRYRRGSTLQELADAYGVVRSTVSYAVNRRTWVDVR